MMDFDLPALFGLKDAASWLEQLEKQLELSVSQCDPELRQPSLRIIKAGGKRLRPFLVMAASASTPNVGVVNKAIKAGAAIELLHIASLVHDDIIDKSKLRHGQPTVSAKEGFNRAILVGDYLIASSHSLAASIDQAIAAMLSRAFAEMCEGQSIELNDVFNVQRSIDRYYMTIRKKTARLLSVACQVGGHCAELSDSQIAALARYGEAFGMSFQLIDDLADILLSKQQAGKPVGNDIKEGNYTLPMLFSLQGPLRTVTASWPKENRLPSQATIRSTLKQDGSLARTIEEIRSYNLQALEAISDFKTSHIIEGFRQLPDAYFQRIFPMSLLQEVL